MPAQDPTATDVAPTWQSELRDAVRSIEELARLLGLDQEQLMAGAAASEQFPLLVPRGFVSRIKPGDPNDPLLRQVLPDAREMLSTAGFSDDPLDEIHYGNQGVVRKYAGRILFVTTGACPVHCRYCFRRAFPYEQHKAAQNDWGNAIDGLEAMPDATEVILSGGDPLALTDRRLENLLDKLVALDRIDTVRIHTRFPIMIPARITRRLTDMLDRIPMKTVVVVHVNHPDEIDANVAHALARLRHCTTALLNQTVLLRGINNAAGTLTALSRRLFDCSVLPYYLHMLDRVSGTAHFEVSDDEALLLIRELRHSLPGYLVPKLVREVPGRLSKIPLV